MVKDVDDEKYKTLLDEIEEYLINGEIHIYDIRLNTVKVTILLRLIVESMNCQLKF